MMPDPDRRPMRVEEFLDSVQEKQQRSRYQAILSPLEPMNHIIRRFIRAVDGLPDLRIVKYAPIGDTELRDISQTVHLSDGLLDYCLEVDARASATFKRKSFPLPLGKFSVARISLMWAYGHEITHFLRRHQLVEKHFGGDPATKQALEFDADMCSAALIFRYLLKYGGASSVLHAKTMALTNIYWFLRCQVNDADDHDFRGTDGHPHMASRLVDILGKLAMLVESGPPDPNCESPATREHLVALTRTLGGLEATYFNVPPEMLPGVSKILKYIKENVGQRYTSERSRRWDQISPLIDQFAVMERSFVDNESSIAFMGDIFSLPHDSPATAVAPTTDQEQLASGDAPDHTDAGCKLP